MNKLNFPPFEYRVKKENDKVFIFDIIRKQYILLTPEEWVRQHVVHFLINHKKYPSGLIATEREIKVCGLKKRFDIVCFDRNLNPLLVIECKAPHISLNQKVFDQAFEYNLTLIAKYIAITNGYDCICGEVGSDSKFRFIEEIPDYLVR